MYLLFDIGGSKTRICTSDGKSLTSLKVVATLQGYQQSLDLLKAYFLNLKSPPKSICGGIAGTFNQDYSQLNSAPHLPNFVGKPLKAELEENFHCPVYLQNDAALEGLGEAIHGAGINYRTIYFLTIGTGVGGIRIIDGQIDPNSERFEPGHRIFSGNLTLEETISGSALFKKHHQTAEDINDPKIWNRIAIDLSSAVNKLIEIWSPEIIILGGSVATRIPVDQLRVTTRVIPAKLGDRGGLFGALEYLNQKTTVS